METDNKEAKTQNDTKGKKKESVAKTHTQIENNPLKNVKTVPVESVLRYNNDKEQNKREEKNDSASI